MKFTFKPINLNFEFDEANFINLVIENKFWFCNFIESIKSSATEIENNFIFDEESEKIFKNIDIVFSPFDLNWNNLSNGLIKYLVNNDYCINFDYIKSELIAFGDSVVLESDLNLDYDDTQINLQKILRIFNFRLYDTELSHTEKLINYLETYHKISPDIFFCFIDICNYFECEDFDLIFEWCKLNGVFAVNVASDVSIGYNFDKSIVVDNDLCILK